MYRWQTRDMFRICKEDVSKGMERPKLCLSPNTFHIKMSEEARQIIYSPLSFVSPTQNLALKPSCLDPQILARVLSFWSEKYPTNKQTVMAEESENKLGFLDVRLKRICKPLSTYPMLWRQISRGLREICTVAARFTKCHHLRSLNYSSPVFHL